MSQTAKLLLSPVLVAQAVATRRRLTRLPEAEGERSGHAGRGPVLRLLIVGDSSAAGVGVARQKEALSGQLGRALRARIDQQPADIATAVWPRLAARPR